MKKNSKYFGLFLCFILLDRLAKILAVYFETYTINYGISLGLLKEYPLVSIIFSMVGIIVLLKIVNEISKESKVSKLLIVMVISGGLGNLLDRIIFGGVIDFIKILDLPVFNFADVMITLGIGLIFLNIAKEWYAEKRISSKN